MRAALLYADEIELVSPIAQMIGDIAALNDGDLMGWFNLLASLPDEFINRHGRATMPANWRTTLPPALLAVQLGPDLLQRMPGGDQITAAQLDRLRAMPDQLSQAEELIRTNMEGLIERSQASELQPAISAGIIKITPVMQLSEMGDTSGMPERFIALITELMHDRNVRLLFDEGVANIANHLVRAGMVSPHRLTLQHAGEAAVGSGLVARLPAFTAAPIDELLDLRKDLSVPLIRYRRAVVRLAEQASSSPFDESVPTMVDDLWRTEVAPALADLRAQLGDNGLVREITRHLGKDLKTVIAAVAGPGLWVGLGSLDSLDGAARAAAGLVPIIGAGAHAAAGARDERRGARARAEAHDMFYL